MKKDNYLYKKNFFNTNSVRNKNNSFYKKIKNSKSISINNNLNNNNYEHYQNNQNNISDNSNIEIDYNNDKKIKLQIVNKYI